MPQDIATYTVNKKDWVARGGGGISTFYFSGLPARSGNWWYVPKDTDISSQLEIVNDEGDHWLWRPKFPMPLKDYEKYLADSGTPSTWVKNVIKQEDSQLFAPAELSSSSPLPRSSTMNWSPKARRFILIALDEKIERLSEWSRDASRSEDDLSDIGNDLCLYTMIRREVAAQEASEGATANNPS